MILQQSNGNLPKLDATSESAAAVRTAVDFQNFFRAYYNLLLFITIITYNIMFDNNYLVKSFVSVVGCSKSS